MKDAETTHRASPLGKKLDDGMTRISEFHHLLTLNPR